MVKNLVYTDTDSAYYFEKDNEITTKLDIGDSLGKMKDELSVNNYITLQICLASKTYGYLTFLPENGKTEVLRNKGFSTTISDEVNVNSFINLYRNKNTYITIANKNHFLKNRREGKIYMQNLSKKFNFNYLKRIVVSDNKTLPWGYEW